MILCASNIGGYGAVLLGARGGEYDDDAPCKSSCRVKEGLGRGGVGLGCISATTVPPPAHATLILRKVATTSSSGPSRANSDLRHTACHLLARVTSAASTLFLHPGREIRSLRVHTEEKNVVRNMQLPGTFNSICPWLARFKCRPPTLHNPLADR